MEVEETPDPDSERDVTSLSEARARLQRWYSYLFFAWQYYVLIADWESDKPDIPEAMEAWRNCYRIYNTAMVTWHGRGNWTDESAMCDLKVQMDMDVHEHLKRKLEAEPEDELIRFAGDADIDANNLQYRFPVIDPSVDFVSSRLSNIGVLTGRDAPPQIEAPGDHHRADVPATDDVFLPDTIDDREHGDDDGYDWSCPWWVAMGWHPCGRKCRAPLETVFF